MNYCLPFKQKKNERAYSKWFKTYAHFKGQALSNVLLRP